MSAARHLVVIGGGIAGLAAALEATRHSDVTVTVLEASARCGGKLALGALAGISIDTGAESLLNTRPEAVDLASEVGLSEFIVHPHTGAARLLSGGQLRPIPTGLVMGAPGDADAVADSDLLGPADLDAVRRGLDSPVPEIAGDVGIGEFVATAVGRAAADRLVDPLLAGVYAGNADLISMQAAAPSLYASAAQGGTFGDVVARARRAPSGPVFAGISGGIGTLPDATIAVLKHRGVEVRTSTAALGLRLSASQRWTITTRAVALDDDDTSDAEEISADGVVLAVPAFAASALLTSLPLRSTPQAVFTSARALDAIPYADVAVLSFAFPADEVPPSVTGSGFLIPSVEDRFIKASTFSSLKWAWTGERGTSAGVFVLRASVGRFGESVEAYTDGQLIERATRDLNEILPGLPSAVDVRVDRWTQALPQYLVGHVDAVRRIRGATRALPGLLFAGAAYDGIGIAACIASGRHATADLLEHLTRH